MAAVIKRETNKRMHVVIIILLLTGCVKDAEFSGDTKYPSLETLAVTDINKDGATLNGVFHSHGKVKPEKLWFHWECRNCPGVTYALLRHSGLPSGDHEKFSLRLESTLVE